MTTPPPPVPGALVAVPARSLPPRRQATSRRRPAPLPVPAPLELPPVVAAAPRATFLTVRLADPPLPRHRVRSGLLLVVIVVVVGLVVALIIGIVAAALAFGLRSAVTS